MKNFHKIASFLPIYMVWYWLFCAFFLSKTDFYRINFSVLDNVDSVIVFVSMSHFMIYYRLYGATKVAYLTCMYFIILLNFLYFCLSEALYYFLFYSIIINFIIASFWKTQTLKN